ncbi:hypothetical protein AB7281_22875 [Providencia rettgeri]
MKVTGGTMHKTRLWGLGLLLMSVWAKADVAKDIIGIWALSPLQNGLADVFVFKPNNEYTLQAFRCDLDTEKTIDEGRTDGHYRISGNDLFLTPDDGTAPTQLRFKGIKYNEVVLNLGITEMNLAYILTAGDAEVELDYLYNKVNVIKSLCPNFFKLNNPGYQFE